MPHEAPSPDPDDTAPAPDRYAGLPADWSDSAKEVYVSIEEENGTLTATVAAAVFEAAALIAHADICLAQVVADGLMVPGSNGQNVGHPLISEARLARTAALGALKSLGLASGQSASSQAGAALVSKRWHGPRSNR
jgi:hypothetical protein